MLNASLAKARSQCPFNDASQYIYIYICAGETVQGIKDHYINSKTNLFFILQ